MTKFSIIFLALCLFVSVASGQELPLASDFNLKDIDQDMVSLSNYKNKSAVILIFWTTWCPMCLTELRNLNNMYSVFKKEGIEVLAIDSGELEDTVSSFINSSFLAYRVLLDKDTYVTRSYKAEGFPLFVLINKEGKIVFQDNYFPLSEYRKLILTEE